MSNQSIAVMDYDLARMRQHESALRSARPTRDPIFDRWLAVGLVWLPEKGVGYFPVTAGDAPYDADYFAKYRAYRRLPTFEPINAARVALVNRYVGPATLVCDVGIGDGAFIEARGSRWTLGYDVNPVAVDWLKTNGAWCDPYAQPVEVLTFWDCLEHIHDASALLANVTRWVFVSIPIVPGDGPPSAEWKHFRRDEHCWYFTRKGLIAWMAAHGFECVEVNANEVLAGREDIEAFAFRRAS